MTNLKSLDTFEWRSGVPPLLNGDRLKQPDFHRRYEKYPDDTKFELIGGIVYMASPARLPHGKYHLKLGSLLSEYEEETPGVEGAAEATAILNEESEPQPDLMLRILEGCGGQSRSNESHYLEGAPEFLAEVAYSSRTIDLNQKREAYQQAGVLEYVVLSIEDRRVFWFHFPTNTMIEADKNGIQRSLVMPGLWLHEESLLALNMKRTRAILRRGVASKEHQDFVKRLRQAKRKT